MFKKLKSISKSSQLDSLLKYTFVTLLIFVPLYPKFPLFNVPGTYVAIRLEDVLIAILAVLTFLKLSPSFTKLLALNTTKAIAIYWLVGGLAVINGVFLTHTATLPVGILHWARRIEYMIPFFTALVLAQNEDNLRFYSKLMLPIAIGVLLYALGQMYAGIPVITTQNEEFSKGVALSLQPGVNLSSTFAGHYDLAIYLVVTIAISLSLAFYYRQRLLRSAFLVGIVGLIWLLPQTGSRIAFGALLFTIPLVLIFLKRYAFIPLFLLITLFFGLSTPKLAGRFSTILKVFEVKYLQEQIKGVFDSRVSLIKPVYAIDTYETTAPGPQQDLRPIQQDRSTSIRLDVEWPRALRALAKNPLLGTGYSSITLATDNDYLRALGETGLLGFLSFMAVILSLISDILISLKSKLSSLRRHYQIGMLVAIAAFLFVATFIDVFEASKIATLFWMYTGLAVGSFLTTKKLSL